MMERRGTANDRSPPPKVTPGQPAISREVTTSLVRARVRTVRADYLQFGQTPSVNDDKGANCSRWATSMGPARTCADVWQNAVTSGLTAAHAASRDPLTQRMLLHGRFRLPCHRSPSELPEGRAGDPCAGQPGGAAAAHPHRTA